MVWTKMSKSRGNVVLPEEVVHGVCDLAPGYVFRDRSGRLVDYRAQGVWLQAGRGYLTSTKFGREPVFLHVDGNPVPAYLTDWETVQHPDEMDFWIALLEKYDPDFRNPFDFPES